MGTAKAHEQNWMQGDAPLKGAMLALLSRQPAHGYALAKRLNRLLGPAADIEAKSLYPKLSQLEAAGLVSSAGGSPKDTLERRVYHPTSDTELAVADWMARTSGHPPIRSELQLKIIVSTARDVPMLLRAMETYELSCLGLLSSNVEADVEKVSWTGVVINIVRAGATTQIKAELDWVRAARRELEEGVELFPPS
jgi:DNA-binding PadR family transcriptional regulator